MLTLQSFKAVNAVFLLIFFPEVVGSMKRLPRGRYGEAPAIFREGLVAAQRRFCQHSDQSLSS